MGKQSRMKQEARQNGRCPVPDCGQTVSPTSRFGLCSQCTKVVNTLLFALPRVKVNPPPMPPSAKPPVSKLIIPGQQTPFGAVPPRQVDPKL